MTFAVQSKELSKQLDTLKAEELEAYGASTALGEVLALLNLQPDSPGMIKARRIVAETAERRDNDFRQIQAQWVDLFCQFATLVPESHPIQVTP